MEYALDSNLGRVRPLTSGQRAICPLCFGTVIAKCGEIYVWHWQHHQDRNCDPWQEHETEWHRKWKSLFPESWREVVIERNSEEHIADVKTERGIVLEFQNSSISRETIRVREQFYDAMIWVVNASNFKNNFSIGSMVRTQTRHIDKEESNEIQSMHREHDEKLKSLHDSIEVKKREINQNDESLKKLKNLLVLFEIYLGKEDIIKNEIIKKWNSLNKNENYDLSRLLRDIENEFAKSIVSNNEKISSLRKLEMNANETLLKFNRLNDFKHEKASYKLVEYDEIKSSDFKYAIAIRSETLDTLFPNIVNFEVEIDFINFKFRQRNYKFGLNVEYIVSRYVDLVKNYNEEINRLELLVECVIDKAVSKINSAIEKEILSIKNKIDINNGKTIVLFDELNLFIKKQSETLINGPADIAKYRDEISRRNNVRRSRIMQANKGLYHYRWKHARPSWNAAICPIFLDFGDHLFQLIDHETLRKIEKSDFIKEHNSRPRLSTLASGE